MDLSSIPVITVPRRKNPERGSVPRRSRDLTHHRTSAIFVDQETGKVVGALLKRVLTPTDVKTAHKFKAFKRKSKRSTITNDDSYVYTSAVGYVFPQYVPPAYPSLATQQDIAFFESSEMRNFFKKIEQYYKELDPTDYRRSVALTRLIPKAQRIGNAWHTAQVNVNVPSKYHTDSHDSCNFSAIIPVGDFEGGEIVLPAWGLCLEACEGDLVLCCQKEFHGNLRIRKGVRTSIILYTIAGFKHYRNRTKTGAWRANRSPSA